MSLFYEIMVGMGYFAVFIISSAIAIIFAYKKYSWISYLTGSIITLFSLIGNQKLCSNYYDYQKMGIYWAIYVILVIFVGVVIYIRHGICTEKSNKCNNSETDNNVEKDG